MAQQIKKKFLSAEVINYFDNQIDAVESSVGSLGSNKADVSYVDSQDAAKLDEAKAYTDAEIAAIPSVDLSNYYNKSEVNAKESALDLRIDALEAFGPDQTVHVSKNGSDSNSGKQHAPFLTITAALNSISDSAPTKRYVVKVSSGAYSEAIALKANVFVVGEGQKESVRITGAITMGSSFTANSSFDNRSGFANVSLLSGVNFDWNAVQSAAGKLYFSEVVFGSTLSLNGYNNAVAQAQFNSCVIFGTFTVSGINVGVFTNNVCYGSINLNQHPNGGMATILSASGGFCSGTITQATTVNDFNRRVSTFLRSFPSENLVINGPVSYADVDLVSQGKSSTQKLNGGQLVALTPKISHDIETQMIKPISSSTHNLGDWGKQWAWSFGNVHASSGTDLFLISYPVSYAPDSSGKSIGIYTDGAGLQTNVNGGDIVLETAATSGTGVRGKIELNGKEIDVTSKQIKNLANGSASTDAVNKGQLDSAIASIPAVDLSPYYTKTEVDSIESGLQSQINTEKGRVDAILLAADADKDSFAEIVTLINSVDVANDTAFAGYVLSNDAAVSALDVRLDTAEPKISTLETKVSALEAKGFSKGSQVVGAELGYIDLDRTYATILSMSVGRLAVHEGDDYTTSVIGGVTRITWIGPLLSPGGAEAIETGDKVFWSGAY